MTYTSESESSEAVDTAVPQIKAFSEGSDHVKPSEPWDPKVYTCDQSGCSAKFSRPWKLAAHRAVHLGQKPFQCDFEGCNRAYTSNYHLRRHEKTAHSSIKFQKKFRCDFPGCNKEFTLIQNSKKHYRRTHVEKPCKICGEYFFNHLQLKKHSAVHSVGYNYKCQVCDATFYHEGQFNRHKRGHNLHVCPIKGCAQAYRNWSHLRKHLVTHPYDYVCSYCKKGYRRRKFLKGHIERHMKNEFKRKPFELKKVRCDICQAELLGKGSLKRHKKVIHENIQPVKKPDKPKKPRASRKDKGIPKRPIAVILSEAIVPKEIEKKLIHTENILEIQDLLSIMQETA